MSIAPATELLTGLTPAQLEAVTTPGQPLCILAGAVSYTHLTLPTS